MPTAGGASSFTGGKNCRARAWNGLVLGIKRRTNIFIATFGEHNGSIVKGTFVATKVVLPKQRTAKTPVKLFTSTGNTRHCLQVHQYIEVWGEWYFGFRRQESLRIKKYEGENKRYPNCLKMLQLVLLRIPLRIQRERVIALTQQWEIWICPTQY